MWFFGFFFIRQCVVHGPRNGRPNVNGSFPRLGLATTYVWMVVFIVGFKGLEAVFGRPVDAVGKSPPPPPQQQQKQQQQQFSRAGEVWAFSSFRHAGYSVRWLLSLTFPNQPISNRAQERWGLEVTHF